MITPLRRLRMWRGYFACHSWHLDQSYVVFWYTHSVTHFFLAFSVELQSMYVMLKSSLELLRLFSNDGVSCACWCSKRTGNPTVPLAILFPPIILSTLDPLCLLVSMSLLFTLSFLSPPDLPPSPSPSLCPLPSLTLLFYLCPLLPHNVLCSFMYYYIPLPSSTSSPPLILTLLLHSSLLYISLPFHPLLPFSLSLSPSPSLSPPVPPSLSPSHPQPQTPSSPTRTRWKTWSSTVSWPTTTGRTLTKSTSRRARWSTSSRNTTLVS